MVGMTDKSRWQRHWDYSFMSVNSSIINQLEADAYI